MQYQEVSTEPIACEYYKNTQNLHHKNLTVQTWGFLLKQELSHLGHHQIEMFHVHASKSVYLRSNALSITGKNLRCMI